VAATGRIAPNWKGQPRTARDDRILADRLRHGLRYPATPDAVLIEIMAVRYLLARIEGGLLRQEADMTASDGELPKGNGRPARSR
jgi:hypothetical protein